MGDPVRVLNDRGLQDFRKYLAEIREGSTGPPPFHLLTHPRCSEAMADGLAVEGRIFQDRLDAARYLYGIFQRLPHSQVNQNVGLWSWLALYYFDQVSPSDPMGKRTPGQDSRHILDLDSRRYYRHLLYGLFNIFALHGEEAPLLCSGPLHRPSTHYEAIASRQGLVTNQGVVDAAHFLYYDLAKGTVKRGATATPKPGTLGRFIDVIEQLDLTHDLYSMTGEEILSLLPPEFDAWQLEPGGMKSLFSKLIKRVKK